MRRSLDFLVLMNTKKEMETLILELVVNFMKLLLYLSPFVVGFIGDRLRSRMEAEFQRMNAQGTEEQLKEYVAANDLKYLITFRYGDSFSDTQEIIWDVMKSVAPSRRNKNMTLADLKYECHFSQVSEADAQAFDTWLTQTDASHLEFQTIGGPCVQINREIISGVRKELEIVPRGKASSKERFIAIRGEDGNQIHSFETGPYKAPIVSRNFVCFLLVILLYVLNMFPIDGVPLMFGVIAICVSDYDNLPFLLKQWANEE